MPRTAITIQQYNTKAGEEVSAYQNADGINGMELTNDGRVVLLVKNGAGVSRTVNITSVACSHGRTETVSTAIGAGKEYAFGPFPPDLYNQDGKVQVDFSSQTDVTVKGIKI